MTGFPDAWKVKPLVDVVDILDSRRLPLNAKERANRLGDIPYYGATGQVGWIDAAIYDEPLILLGEDGVQFFDANKPKSYLIDGPAWVNNHAHVLRARGIDRRFLNYHLNTADYRGYANGTTRLKLTQAAMKRIPVPVPPVAEQLRIVDLLEDHLSRLDAAADSVRKSLRRLDVLRRLVVKEMATGDAVPLKQLAIGSGYGTSVKCEFGGVGPAVVRIPNLVGGRIVLDDEKRAVDAAVDLSGAMLVPGDVLVIRTNGSKDLIGRSGVVQDGVDAAFASYLIRYQVDTSRIRPEWLHTMLGSPAIRAEIERLAASSAGQHNLSLGKLDGLLISTPSLGEQDASLARLAALDDQLNAMRRALDVSLRRGDRLRRSLLAAAFSGNLSAKARSVARSGRS